jgi:hypothetical protein
MERDPGEWRRLNELSECDCMNVCMLSKIKNKQQKKGIFLREKANLGRADGGGGGPVPHKVRDARLRLLQPVDVHPRQLLREVIRQLRSEQFITLF